MVEMMRVQAEAERRLAELQCELDSANAEVQSYMEHGVSAAAQCAAVDHNEASVAESSRADPTDNESPPLVVEALSDDEAEWVRLSPEPLKAATVPPSEAEIMQPIEAIRTEDGHSRSVPQSTSSENSVLQEPPDQSTSAVFEVVALGDAVDVPQSKCAVDGADEELEGPPSVPNVATSTGNAPDTTAGFGMMSDTSVLSDVESECAHRDGDYAERSPANALQESSPVSPKFERCTQTTTGTCPEQTMLQADAESANADAAGADFGRCDRLGCRSADPEEVPSGSGLVVTHTRPARHQHCSLSWEASSGRTGDGGVRCDSRDYLSDDRAELEVLPAPQSRPRRSSGHKFANQIARVLAEELHSDPGSPQRWMPPTGEREPAPSTALQSRHVCAQSCARSGTRALSACSSSSSIVSLHDADIDSSLSSGGEYVSQDTFIRRNSISTFDNPTYNPDFFFAAKEPSCGSRNTGINHDPNGDRSSVNDSEDEYIGRLMLSVEFSRDSPDSLASWTECSSGNEDYSYMGRSCEGDGGNGHSVSRSSPIAIVQQQLPTETEQRFRNVLSLQINDRGLHEVLTDPESHASSLTLADLRSSTPPPLPTFKRRMETAGSSSSAAKSYSNSMDSVDSGCPDEPLSRLCRVNKRSHMYSTGFTYQSL